MANFVGHLIAGLSAAAIISYSCASFSLLSTTEMLMISAATIFGSLFPDMDTKSIIQLWTYRVIALALLLLYIHNITALLIIIPIAMMLPLVVRHRGIFHQIWFLTAIAGIVYMLLPCIITVSLCVRWGISFGFLTGAMIHLLLDYGVIKTVKKIIILR